MARVSHLKSLQALELAIRLGSLKEAATILGITPAAVGQRIKSLEDYLGLNLLVRTRTGLRASDELSKAMPHLRAAFQELSAAAEILEFERPEEIHIAAQSSWVELWLMPRLPSFRKDHQNIRFCINGEGDAPMRLGPADIEVTFGPGAKDEKADPLFRDFVVPVASPEVGARVTRNRKKHKLDGFPLLHQDFYKDDPHPPNWPNWIAAFGYRSEAPDRGIRFRQIPPGLEATQSGAGVMMCGLALIERELAGGKVVLPFPVEKGLWTTFSFQARFRPHALNRPQVTKFRDWILSEARQTTDVLEGRVGMTKGN